MAALQSDVFTICAQVEAFYEFYEGLQEGWDGPALLVFASQGKIGARLDRNGLRPARYWKTSDDLVYVASEVGVLNDVLDNAPNITAKGRLGPGQVSALGWLRSRCVMHRVSRWGNGRGCAES